MISRLEDALLRCQDSNGLFRITLFQQLDLGSLRRLRQCSRPLKDILDHQSNFLFEKLYACAPFLENDDAVALERVAQFCQHLTLQLGQAPTRQYTGSSNSKPRRGVRALYDKGRSASRPMPTLKTVDEEAHPELENIERYIWEYLLRQFPRLAILTLRVYGEPWGDKTTIERTLLILRVCLERAQPHFSNLHTVNLHPIHGLGILFFRWTAFGAFYEVPNATGTLLWQNLTNLSIRLQNPLAVPDTLSEAQHTMLLRILNSYLRSFTPTLQTLKFIWLDKPGPSPLLLDTEKDLFRQIPLQWHALKEFWFGNIIMPNKTLSLIPERAPNVTKVKALRSTHQDSEDGDAWMEISMERITNMRSDHRSYHANSIYSQTQAGESQVSLASTVIPAGSIMDELNTAIDAQIQALSTQQHNAVTEGRRPFTIGSICSNSDIDDSDDISRTSRLITIGLDVNDRPAHLRTVGESISSYTIPAKRYVTQ